jgi:hypothetical protein
MTIFKETRTYICDSEQAADAKIIEERKRAADEGFLIGKTSTIHKEKKAKGEVIGEHTLLSIEYKYCDEWEELEG